MSVREASLSDILSSRKYHSAIITTYTLDPIFTKTVFIPLLQSNRIRNVIILVDQRELQKSMQNWDLISILKRTSFLLLPASTQRLFHPKLMLFVGENSGLCVIGSGNLTHSGMGGNSEIWGAYHFSPDNQQNAEIFKDVWNFLQKHNPDISGIGGVKSRNWILNHSTWLKDIISNTENISESPVNIFTNDQDNTIWQRFIDKIKDKDLSKITLLSPFYDKRGKALRELKALLPKVPIDLVYDENGTVPELSKSIELVRCFNWKEVASNSEKLKSSNKLHAKAIITIDSEGKETILFGSSNFTNAGLGLDGVGNVELSLFSESAGFSYKNELGLSFKGAEAKKIDQIFTSNDLIEEPSTGVSSENVFILYAEQNGDVLNIDFDVRSIGQEVTLKFFDRSEKPVYEKNIQSIDNVNLEISLSEIDPVPIIEFIEISQDNSKYLVYQSKSLNVDNPDPKAARIRNALTDISKSSFGQLHELFTDLFNDLTSGLNQKEEISGSQSSKSTTEEEDEEDEKYYSREELKEKRRVHGNHITSEDFVSEGLFAIIKLLDEELESLINVSVNVETVATDSADEIDVSQEEFEAPEKLIIDQITEAENKKRGYQSYFKKAIKYYSKIEEFLEKASYSMKQRFINNWILVISVALHAIRTDLKKDFIDDAYDLNKRTTISPYQKEKEVTIEDISIKLITSITGRLSLSKYDFSIEEYLDSEKRILTAVKMIELLHLRYWHDTDTFLSASQNVMEFFKVNQGKMFLEFRESFEEQIKFYGEDVKNNDWRYHQHFVQNLKTFKYIL